MAETDVKSDVQQKKRKRTGKEREERKRAAIQVRLVVGGTDAQAKLEAEAGAAGGEAVQDEPAEAPETKAEAAVNAEKGEAVSPEVDFGKIAQRIVS